LKRLIFSSGEDVGKRMLRKTINDVRIVREGCLEIIETL